MTKKGKENQETQQLKEKKNIKTGKKITKNDTGT